MHTSRFAASVLLMLVTTATDIAWSHDPVFGLGPHVLFKDGVEIAPELNQASAGNNEVNELGVELTYGLTGDWSAGLVIPYVDKTIAGTSANGQGDLRLFTKYRFWRLDGPGVQQSASVALKIKTDTGNNAVSTGTTDTLLGLTYGYEGRKWYRWAAVRYLDNGKNSTGLKRGSKMFFDLVGGIRPTQSSYLEPDTVWLLELNGEFSQRNELNGIELASTGGKEWFISPGIFWTLRNFAVKAGVQIPIASDLNGTQTKTDYRARLVLEWHL